VNYYLILAPPSPVAIELITIKPSFISYLVGPEPAYVTKNL